MEKNNMDNNTENDLKTDRIKSEKKLAPKDLGKTHDLGESDAPSAMPGDLNFRSPDFDMESKFSMDHDNNHDYVPEGVPNRNQEFQNPEKNSEISSETMRP